jgi:hypothetical protein
VKKLQDQLMQVVRDLEKVARRIDRLTKRVEKIPKPKRTKAVELSQIPKIDPAILARVIAGKICPTDIILGHIITNPDGIDINTLEKKTGFEDKAIKQIILSLRQEGKIRSKPKEGLQGRKSVAGISRSLYFEA